MLKSIGSQGTDDGARARSEVPNSNAKRLLSLLVPHTTDQNQARRNGGFKDSKQDTDSNEGSVVLAGAIHRDTDTPTGDLDSKVFGSREALHQVGVYRLAEEVTDIEDQCKV